MTTLYISIGNTDNKLTQSDWSDFCNDLLWVTKGYGVDRVYGEWYSPSNSPYQNMCIAVETSALKRLKAALSWLAGAYEQDSIAVATAETEFIQPKKEYDD